MMPWPVHCKIEEEPIQQKRNFTKYPLKVLRCCEVGVGVLRGPWGVLKFRAKFQAVNDLST